MKVLAKCYLMSIFVIIYVIGQQQVVVLAKNNTAKKSNATVREQGNTTVKNVSNRTTAVTENESYSINTSDVKQKKTTTFAITSPPSIITSILTMTNQPTTEKPLIAQKLIPPPKKYVPPPIFEKIPTSYTNPFAGAGNNNGPTKVILLKTNSVETLTDLLTCPKEDEAPFQLFAMPCQSDRECTSRNKEQRCCKLFGFKNCYKGVPKPVIEQQHAPIFGFIPRKCPTIPLAELWWDLKTCETDNECWPRLCCPDGNRKYCRTSAAEYTIVPEPIARPLTYLTEYLECTPPPPPVFDVHPKQCTTTFDCFPNVCCQEAGKKFCRPPKKSVLTVMANFFNTGLLRRLTENLVIKRKRTSFQLRFHMMQNAYRKTQLKCLL